MKYYSNEIVFRGHPDKVCDQISMAILQECINQDRKTRAGIEVAGGKGKILVTGEVTTKAEISVPDIIRSVLSSVGYPLDYEIIDNLGMQSSDIAQGVDIGGAGDNGMMFGFACNDTDQLLSTAQVILQEFAETYDAICETDDRFLSDGKAQITGIYDKNELVGIKDFVVCYQNTEKDRYKTDAIIREYVDAICEGYHVPLYNIWLNPTGRFEIGGFEADAGLTGRKIVVDAYQSFGNVGGGCMNGKDPTKVDFSGAHKARQIACRLVKQGYERAEVQLSYAIGKKLPLAVYARTDKGEFDLTVKLGDECTPKRIIDDLNLLDCDFVELAKFGHFRNDLS